MKYTLKEYDINDLIEYLEYDSGFSKYINGEAVFQFINYGDEKKYRYYFGEFIIAKNIDHNFIDYDFLHRWDMSNTPNFHRNFISVGTTVQYQDIIYPSFYDSNKCEIVVDKFANKYQDLYNFYLSWKDRLNEL